MLWVYIVVFLVSCAFLVKSGTWAVKSLTRIVKYLQMTEFVVAFILMAFVTTIPEFFVGIASGFNGKPELSFGNVIGSNIVNLTLCVAIGVFWAKGLKCEKEVVQRTSFYTLGIALLPILLMLDGTISRIDGIILLLVFVFYMRHLVSQSERFTKVFSNHFGQPQPWQKFKSFLKEFGVFIFSVALLLLSAKGIVWSSIYLALAFNLPLMIIGALIVALGTNLPEITFGIKSIAMGHRDMVLGNLLGAVVSNSTWVLGVTVLISPLKIVSFSPYIIGVIFLILTLLFFTIFSRTGRKINRREAFFLFLIYIVFVALEIWKA